MVASITCIDCVSMATPNEPDDEKPRFPDLALLAATADGTAMRLNGLSRHLRAITGTPMVTRAGGGGRMPAVLGLAGLMLLLA